MATTVSAWAKPGAWALDSEEHEEELNKSHQEQQQQQQQEEEQQQERNKKVFSPSSHSQPLSDFPSLSAAAVTKTKKKKPQSVSLSEFTTGKQVSYGSAKAPTRGLTPDELSILPTGPRERSAEELERSSSRLGGGFRSYGDNNGGGGGGRTSSRDRDRDDSSSNNRWGSNRDEPRRSGGGGLGFTNREPAPPSKADEVDDWGAAKKSSSFERRERGGAGAGAGFFDSQQNNQSRADESDSWLSKKSFTPSSESRRMGSFDRDSRGGGGGGSRFDKEASNGGADSDVWGKKRGEEGSSNENGRPRLVLQPRSVAISNGEQPLGSVSVAVKSNPFGAARPREEVLAEKGQDWKKIDEQLESAKIKELISPANDGLKKSLGNGRLSSPEDRTEKSWRKAGSVDSPTPSDEEKAEKDVDGVEAEN